MEEAKKQGSEHSLMKGIKRIIFNYKGQKKKGSVGESQASVFLFCILIFYTLSIGCI